LKKVHCFIAYSAFPYQLCDFSKFLLPKKTQKNPQNQKKTEHPNSEKETAEENPKNPQ